MHRKSDEQPPTGEARTGVGKHGLRTILGIGLVTALVALSAIWLLQTFAG